MSLSPTSAEFFETMYAEREDPWEFASSQYERDRYAAIVRALGNRRYRRAFEPGCSIGILTPQLASVLRSRRGNGYFAHRSCESTPPLRGPTQCANSVREFA